MSIELRMALIVVALRLMVNKIIEPCIYLHRFHTCLDHGGWLYVYRHLFSNSLTHRAYSAIPHNLLPIPSYQATPHYASHLSRSIKRMQHVKTIRHYLSLYPDHLSSLIANPILCLEAPLFIPTPNPPFPLLPSQTHLSTRSLNATDIAIRTKANIAIHPFSQYQAEDHDT